MSGRGASLVAVLLLTAGLTQAETAYVTDSLRLNVYLTRDMDDQPFAALKSGDSVEIIERDGQLTLVALPDGRTGWVRGAFMQPQEPASRRIVAVTAERDRLAGELAALRASSGERGGELARLRQDLEQARTAAVAAQEELTLAQARNRILQDDLDGLRSGVPWSWLVIAAAVAACCAAVVVWRWFDYRSRKRHGGFRIY